MKVISYIILSILLAAVALALAVAITAMVNHVTFAETLSGWFEAVIGFLSKK